MNEASLLPYKTIKDLPENVRNVLPEHAQHIYLEAYNNAWEQYKDPKKRKLGLTREETAHAVAWAAVKKEYRKDESSGKWVSI